MPETSLPQSQVGDSRKFDVDLFLSNAARKKGRIPHLQEVLEHLINEWGGAEQFARTYHDEFAHCKSNMTRSRMMESILRLMQTQANLAGPPVDLHDISDEELREAASKIVSAFYAEEKASQSPGPGEHRLPENPG